MLMRILRVVIGLSLVCFVFPWLTVSCTQQQSISFSLSGAELAVGKSLSAGAPSSGESPFSADMANAVREQLKQNAGASAGGKDIPGEPIFFLCAVLAIGALVATWIRGESAAGAGAAVLSLLALGSVILLTSTKRDLILEKGHGMFAATYEFGYFGELLTLAVAAALGGYIFLLTKRGGSNVAIAGDAQSCASCGTALRSGATFCASCGVKVQRRECPQCAAPNSMQARFCLKCGCDLVGADATLASTAIAAAAAVAQCCASCGAALRSGAGFCASCGTKVQLRDCPRCNSGNAPAARFCLQCGQDLNASTPPSGSFASQSVEKGSAQLSAVPVQQAVVEPRRELEALPPVAMPIPQPAIAMERKPVNKTLLAAIAAAGIVLVAGLLGYLYWTGVVGDRPESVARAISAELRQQGFPDVLVTVDRNWTASVSGSVVGQDKVEAVKALIGAHSEIRGSAFEALKARPSAKEIQEGAEKSLATMGLAKFSVAVREDGVVTLTGVADGAREKSAATAAVRVVPGVRDVDSQVGVSPDWLQREIDAMLRNDGHTGVRVQVRSSEDIGIYGTVGSDYDRAAVIARVIETGNMLGEAIAPSSVHDEMTVAAAAAVATPTRQSAAPAVASAFESTAASQPAAQGSAPVRGVWVGSVQQAIFGFQVNLRLEAAAVGQPAGSTVYSTDGKSSACQGSLLLVEATPDQYTFEETIGKRGLLCPGGGTLRMSIKDANTAKVKWSRTATPDKVAAKGDVQRR